MKTAMSGDDALVSAVARARDGDAAALEAVVRALQNDVFRLALRMTAHGRMPRTSLRKS